jgi:hypothetical protein
LLPLVGLGAGFIGATVLTPLVAAPVLGAVGFSAAGPVAGKWPLFSYTTLRHCRTFPPLRYVLLGTFAAVIQSGIGNVAAGSLFAGAQATAMGAGVPILGQVIGGAVTGVIGVIVAAI